MDKAEKDHLGKILYRKGRELLRGTGGRPVNPEEGVRLLTKAAGLGITNAFTCLGVYNQKQGDYETGYFCFLEAALAGNPESTYRLGKMYHDGCYVRQDYEKAYGYFEKACQSGVKGAFFYMGYYAQKGLTGEPDPEQAARYYMEGVEKGSRACVLNLGCLYAKGLGVPRDPTQAVALFQIAGAWGSSKAFYNLGWYYEHETDTEEEACMALYYYSKGAELGDERCREALDRLKAG